MTAPAALPWDHAWQEALYGAEGFYRRQAPAEHFTTSAQGIPGGAEVLAGALLDLAERHGCRRVVDVGAGRGELLAALARDRRADGMELCGVDVVARRPSARVDWLVSPGGAALPPDLDRLEDTLVVAHEWLDVIPCPVAQREGLTPGAPWREVRVALDPDGAVEELGDPLSGDALAWARRYLDGSVLRAEIGLPRERALAELVARVRSGLVVAVDYGHTRADRPRTGTLTGFRHGREVDPVPDGERDLTAHVAVDALLDTVGGTAQRQAEVLAGGRGDHAPGSLAALARRQARIALGARGGLGDFWWVMVPVTRAA